MSKHLDTLDIIEQQIAQQDADAIADLGRALVPSPPTPGLALRPPPPILAKAGIFTANASPSVQPAANLDEKADITKSCSTDAAQKNSGAKSAGAKSNLEIIAEKYGAKYSHVGLSEFTWECGCPGPSHGGRYEAMCCQSGKLAPAHDFGAGFGSAEPSRPDADRIGQLEFQLALTKEMLQEKRTQFADALIKISKLRRELEMQSAAEPASMTYADWFAATVATLPGPSNADYGAIHPAPGGGFTYFGSATLEWNGVTPDLPAAWTVARGGLVVPAAAMSNTMALLPTVAGHRFEGAGSDRRCVEPGCKGKEWWSDLVACTEEAVGKSGWSHDGLSMSRAEFDEVRREEKRLDEVASVFWSAIEGQGRSRQG